MSALAPDAAGFCSVPIPCLVEKCSNQATAIAPRLRGPWSAVSPSTPSARSTRPSRKPVTLFSVLCGLAEHRIV